MSNTELTNEFPKGIRYLEQSDRIWWKIEAMKTTPQEVIYWGAWQEFGKLYNVKVDNGCPATVVNPGEDVKQRSIETKEIF